MNESDRLESAYQFIRDNTTKIIVERAQNLCTFKMYKSDGFQICEVIFSADMVDFMDRNDLEKCAKRNTDFHDQMVGFCSGIFGRLLKVDS